MDSRTFDRLSRLLGGAVTRRAGLAAVSAALGLGALGSAGAKREEAEPRDGQGGRNRDRRRKPGIEGPCGDGSRKANVCTKDTQCCTGYCRKGLKNKDGSGRCRCLRKGQACKPTQTCCKGSCVDGVCQKRNGRKIPTGQPCTPADTCEDAAASCVAYASGDPAGTYCLLAKSAACTDSAQCVTGNCTGTCTSCTVCASGCDFQTIDAAWAAATADAVISIAPGQYTADLTIDKSVTFERCGVTGSVEWQVADSGMALSMSAVAGTLTLKHLDFRPLGSTPKGAVFISGDGSSIFPSLVADGITIEGFEADSYSPIYVERGSSATIANSTFTNNNGYEEGGAIYIGNGTNPSLTLTNCTFTGNFSDDSYGGGAIYFVGETMAVTGCTFTENRADTYGGAIYFDGTTLTITGSTFTGNSAKESGGALNLREGTVTIENSTFTGNIADSDSGGAIQVEAGVTLTMTGCTLSGNQTNQTDNDPKSGGGAIYQLYNSSVTLTDTTISGNSAKSTGGGIMVNGRLAGTATLTLTGTTTVTGNSVTEGASGHGSGIVSLSNGGTVTITGADTRTSGNTTPPDQCERSTNNGSSWTTVTGCAF